MASSGQGWGGWPTGSTNGESSSYSSTSITAYRNSWRSQMPLDPAVYSVENFEPRPNQELVCTVCRGVYREPVECPCRHVFCGDCIRGWLTRGCSGNCPMCRRSVTLWQLVPVVPIVSNMIARLTVRCPNRSYGCYAKVPLETLNRHVDSCEYRQVRCPDCGSPQRAGELNKHRRERCPKRMVHCTRDCGFSLPADRARGHSCVREMRHYISTLERTRNCLRQQLDQSHRNTRRLERELRVLKSIGASAHKYAGYIVGAVSLGSQLRHCGGCPLCPEPNASASGGSTPSNTSSSRGQDSRSERQAQGAQRSASPSPEPAPEELASSSVSVTGTTSAGPSTSTPAPRAGTESVVPTPSTTSLLLSTTSAGPSTSRPAPRAGTESVVPTPSTTSLLLPITSAGPSTSRPAPRAGTESVVPTPSTTSLLLSSASPGGSRPAPVAPGNEAAVSALAAGLASALRLETAVDPGDIVSGTWEMVAAAISPQRAAGGGGAGEAALGAATAAPDSQANGGGAGGEGYRQFAAGDGYFSNLMERLWENGAFNGSLSPQ